MSHSSCLVTPWERVDRVEESPLKCLGPAARGFRRVSGVLHAFAQDKKREPADPEPPEARGRPRDVRGGDGH